MSITRTITGWARLCRGCAALARTFHNQRAVRAGRVARALYRRTDAVLAVSGQIEERCRLAGVPLDRIFRVEGVVDLARFVEEADPADVRDELGLDLRGRPGRPASAPSSDPSRGSPTIAATSC